MCLKNKKFLVGSAVLLLAVAHVTAVSVLNYLPENPQLDGTVNYGVEIQKALNENPSVELLGSGDPDQPFIYGIKNTPDDKYKRGKGLIVPAGHILMGSESAIIKRIPSQGPLIVTEKGAWVKGIIIDGNKKAHWPEFEEMRNVDMGIRIGANNVIEDCTIYNTPGIAFGTYANSSVIRRCKAKNSGYIDVKFKADYYQGKWDRYSGDSFYIRGYNNVVIDCDSEDAFRWDYTTCHENAGGTVYINCNGRDTLWRSYGFIDIEGCDGDGSIMINCKSPNGNIAVSTSGSKLINCTGKRINIHSTDNVLVSGCETYGGGLVVGGWSSHKTSYVRGGASPVVINNIINRSSPGPGVPETSDWSLSVFSTDGEGIVAGNVLNEYKGKQGRGPGMKFDNVKAYDNVIEYKEYVIEENPEKSNAKFEMEKLQRLGRLQEFGLKVPTLAEKLNIDGTIIVNKIITPDALFLKDEKNVGEKEQWFLPGKMPANAKEMPIGQHWDTVIGQYHNYGWYFLKVPLDMDDQHIIDTFYLLFEGIDSECAVWLNGNYIGKHEGWNDPFKMAVPLETLKWKDDDDPNTLVIRVFTPAGLGGIYGNIAAVMTKAK